MAWRFKASKYKNAVPVVPKPENCIRDITIGSYQIYGNSIIASAAFMAFNIGQNGSNLAVFHLDDSGRKGKDMALLHAHIDTVTDMSFSPFHDGLLATGSQDCLIKVWHIPEVGLENNLSDPECILYSKTQRRVETVSFHPVADCLLSTSSYTVLNLWDITTQQSLYSNTGDHTEVIQCINWNDAGSLLATTCKDKRLRILDCRKDRSVVHEVVSHQGIKDSRVVWLSDGFRLLTTGFSATRQREIYIRDIRNLSEPEKNLELDSSTGILLPLYDPDTNMLFLAGKGDTSIFYMEVTNRAPHLIEGLRHNGEQTKGACLVPKRALKVMQGEVNRVLQLTSTMVIPIMYQVPRKTYRDFHADLYPDTTGCVTDLSPAEWIAGKDKVLEKISLDPSKRKAENEVLHRGSLQEICSIVNKREQNGVEGKQVIEASEKAEPESSFDMVKKKFEESIGAKCARPVVSKPEKPVAAQSSEVSAEEEERGKAKLFETDIAPPKPKPRSSRSNSIDCVEERPIAKPRTTHKNSVELTPGLGSSIAHGLMEKTEEEDGPPSAVVEKSQPCVIQSVNPNLPVSGGYKPRLGPKPFTPPKLQSYSSVDNKFVESACHAAEGSNFGEKVSHNSSSESSKFGGGGGCGGGNYGDVTGGCDLEKLSVYEDGVNDFSKVTESDGKLYEKNSVDLRKMCGRGNERKFNCGDACEKIENSFDKHLKKVPNMDECIDKCIKREGSDVAHKNDKTSSCSDDNDDDHKSAKSNKIADLCEIPISLLPTTGKGCISGLPPVKKDLPDECDGFHANWERIAIPEKGGDGKIAVYELSAGENGFISTTLINKDDVTDFCWDPFDDRRLVVASDDGCLRIWTISKEGVGTKMRTPKFCMKLKHGKVVCMKFHPLAPNILAVAHASGEIKVYNTESMIRPVRSLCNSFLRVLCLSWSPCGESLASANVSGSIMVTDFRLPVPRNEDCKQFVLARGETGRDVRTARIVWGPDGKFIITVVSHVGSLGRIRIYDRTSFRNQCSYELDLPPALITPLYDEGTSTLLVTGKGSSVLTLFGIDVKKCQISKRNEWEYHSAHTGLSFLSKKGCDAASLEYIRGVRLTASTVENFGFKIAGSLDNDRVRDLFRKAIATWVPNQSAISWGWDFSQKPARVNLFTGNVEYRGENIL